MPMRPVSQSTPQYCSTCGSQTRAATALTVDDSPVLVPDLRQAADHGDYEIESWADSA
jgi:hypothetical protein